MISPMFDTLQIIFTNCSFSYNSLTESLYLLEPHKIYEFYTTFKSRKI